MSTFTKDSTRRGCGTRVPTSNVGPMVTATALDRFIATVVQRGAELYRDFAWRQTTDPYAILVSEVMLQQTQVSRVEKYFDVWLELFPTVDALAATTVSDVLEVWQGLGYNRRALMLKRTAEQISEQHAGNVPDTYDDLVALPGIGPATATGILAFAFNQPAPYLETNVRTVVLHELFPESCEVSDRAVRDVVETAATQSHERNIEPRTWNYALLDYGAWLKKTVPNPSRRSKHHTVQSAFEGSHRQKRATLLRLVLELPNGTAGEYADRSGYDIQTVEDILAELSSEGFFSPLSNQ